MSPRIQASAAASAPAKSRPGPAPLTSLYCPTSGLCLYIRGPVTRPLAGAARSGYRWLCSSGLGARLAASVSAEATASRSALAALKQRPAPLDSRRQTFQVLEGKQRHR